MRNFVTISAFIFLNLWSYSQCGYLDEFYGDPRIYIQTQNYTVNLFPIIIPLAAFTLGKMFQTTYRWNITWQKCAGISGLLVLNEIIQKNIWKIW